MNAWIKDKWDHLRWRIAITVYRPLLSNFMEAYDKWEQQCHQNEELDSILAQQNVKMSQLIDKVNHLAKCNDHLEMRCVEYCAEIEKLKK